MIQQSELRAVETEQTLVDELAKAPAVAAYEAAKKRLSAHLSRLQERADEEVEPGRYRMIVKQSTTVSYEKFWGCIAGLTPVAAALAKANAAQELVQRLIARDPTAPFISPRVTVQVVRGKAQRGATASPVSEE